MDPQPNDDVKPESLVIPNITQTPPSREEVLGKKPEPVSIDEDSDFLKGVRESNEKRSGKSSDDKDPKPKQKEVETPEKLDATPDKYKEKDIPDPQEGDDEPKKQVKDSIKGLKTVVDAERRRANTAEGRIKELETQVQSYADMQEQVKELDTLKQRVQQLEPFEKVFDLHNNPEFQSKYVTGLEVEINNAATVIKDYLSEDAQGSEDTIAKNAVKITNRKDLNTYLANQGLDSFGVDEVRGHILRAQALIQERSQLEKSPDEAKEILSDLVQQNTASRLEAAKAKVKTRSNDAWAQITALYSRGDDAVELLREKSGDLEHQEKRESILTRASEEFGKVTGVLARLGITDLPLPLAQSLAAHYQLGTMSSELIHANKALKTENDRLKSRLEKIDGYTRPKLGNNGKSANIEEDPKGIAAISEKVFTSARDKVLAGQK